jgi:hypothetical protein
LFVFWYHSPNFLDTPRMYTVLFFLVAILCGMCLWPVRAVRILCMDQCPMATYGWNWNRQNLKTVYFWHSAYFMKTALGSFAYRCPSPLSESCVYVFVPRQYLPRFSVC